MTDSLSSSNRHNSEPVRFLNSFYNQPIGLIDNHDNELVQLADSHSNHNIHYSEPLDSHDSEPVSRSSSNRYNSELVSVNRQS